MSGAVRNIGDAGRPGLVTLAVMALMLAGCGGSPPPTGDLTMLDTKTDTKDETLAFGVADSTYVDAGYRLGPGDTIKLSFMFDHDLDDEIIVRPDGAINLPILGDIHVSGLVPGQLADSVRVAYSRYYTNPQLSINLKSFAPPQCYVLGEAKYPQAVEIRPGMTVAAAVAKAGGVTEYGDLRNTVLVRRIGQNHAVAHRFDMLQYAEGRPMSSDFYLQDYDIIYVPKSFLGKLSTVVDQLFGKMTQIPIFYLRGWEAFNTDLVYNREILPSEVPQSSGAAARRGGQ